MDAEESTSLVVGVLGRIRAGIGGQDAELGGLRQQALLAALAAQPQMTVSTDGLAEAVWDGEPPPSAATTLRSYVARLRRSFDALGIDGTGVVLTDPAGYRLGDQVLVDSALFEAEIKRGRDSLAHGEPDEALRHVERGLARWEGAAFGPFSESPWAAPTAARLEELRLGATELRARALLDAGRVTEAVALLEEVATAHEWREPAVRLHALALYRDGREAEAMGALRRFRTLLAGLHGLDPTHQVSELESMILDRDPRLDRPVGGRRLRGYVLHEVIAQSPLGAVHWAEQPSIGRRVAVTVLERGLADEPDVVRAFEARLQQIARLEHPHVLPIYDYWREPGGAYVVTRLPAATLAQRLSVEPLHREDARRIAEQVASALAAAHERGTTHGALGPEAVAVDERGDAFLWGFSLTADTVSPRDDVASLVDLIRDVMVGSRASSTVDAERLPRSLRGLIDRAAVPPGGGVTAADLSAALTDVGSTRDDIHVMPSGPNPYRGLSAFDEPDAEVFFGRDALVERVLARLRRWRAVAVVGPSGSGKSSLARAGLVPRLRAEGAFVTSMVPGDRPLAALEVALSRIASVPLVDTADQIIASDDGLVHLIDSVVPSPDGEVVLLIDQLEEVFTLSDTTERELFLTALAGAVNHPGATLRLMFTLRADYLSLALSHPIAGPLIRDRSVLVGPLSDVELNDVILMPAMGAGVDVEPALVTALVADATRFPGSLPMVQFALTEVFGAAGDDGAMTLGAYRRIGGIEGVLGQRGEEVFAALDFAGQQATPLLFQRLVASHADGPPSRRRALRSQLERVPESVIEAFGAARLLQFDHDEATREPTVEVSHEALFRAWPRLAAWLEEGEADRRVLTHLSRSATEWSQGGREDSELYRGSRLEAALEFARSHGGQLSAVELAFLDAGRARHRREQEQRKRVVRRLRVLSGGLAVGLVLAVAASVMASRAADREQAARAREAATARSARVDAVAAAASREVANDPELASLLAAQAYSIEPDLESQSALLAALSVEPRIISLRPTPNDSCSERTGRGDVVAFTVVTTQGEAVELRTLDQERIRRLPLPPKSVGTCAALTPDGEHVVIRTNDGYDVFDLDGRLLTSRDDVLAPADQQSMDFHPDKPEAAVVLDSGQVAIVSVPGLETVRTLDLGFGSMTGDSGPVRQDGGPAGEALVRVLAYSEDASLLAVSDGDRVSVVDDRARVVATMPMRERKSGQSFPFVAAGTGQFGYLLERVLVTAPLDKPRRQTTVELDGVSTPYRRGVAIEPGGARAAVATEHGVQAIDLKAKAVLGEPIPVDAGIVDLWWSEVGRLNGLGPNGVYQFDVDRSLLLGRLIGDVGPDLTSGVIALSPDGSGSVVEAGPSPTSRYVNSRTGAELVLGRGTLARPVAGGRWISIAPDTTTVAVGSSAGVESSTTVSALRGRWDMMGMELAGDRAAVFLRDTSKRRVDPTGSRVLLLDVDTGELLSRVDPPKGVVYTAALPFGEEELLVADLDYRWSVMDGEQRTVDGPRVLGAGQDVAAVDVPARRYVTADWNGDLHVVEPDSDVVIDLPGPASYAVNVAFAGGNRLVSRHIDGSTYLWDIPSRRLVGSLWQSPPFAFHEMSVDAKSSDLIQATDEGIARIPLEPRSWLSAVCSRVHRELSAAEWDAVAAGLQMGPGCSLID